MINNNGVSLVPIIMRQQYHQATKLRHDRSQGMPCLQNVALGFSGCGFFSFPE